MPSCCRWEPVALSCLSLRAAVRRSAALLLLAGAVRGEQPPLRIFTAADGLAGDNVLALAEDPRGFLWIGTSTGLSRYDGYGFLSFSTFDGLPYPGVDAILPTRGGDLWVGTPRGLARLRQGAAPGAPRFERFQLGGWDDNTVTSLLEEPGGRIWVGSKTGLFAIESGPAGVRIVRHSLAPFVPDGETLEVRDLALAAGGELWLATPRGLARRAASGGVEAYPVWPDADGVDVVRSLSRRGDFLWLTHDRGIFALRLPFGPAAGGGSLAARAGARSTAPSSPEGWSLPREPGGVVFRSALVPLPRGPRFLDVEASAPNGAAVATNGGLMRFDGRTWRQLGAGEGFPDPSLTTLLEDSAGNLWLGSGTRGLARLAGTPFVSYGPSDGLTAERVSCIFEDRDGNLVVYTSGAGVQRLFLLAGGRFEEITPALLARIAQPSWGWNQLVWQDSRREWWLPTSQGLYRFAATSARGLRAAEPIRHYTEADGLPGDDLFRLFEDRRGDLWLSLLERNGPIVRWHRKTDRFEKMPTSPALTFSAPTAFQEDRAGNLWIGYYSGGLARWNEREGLRPFPVGEGVPGSFVHDLLLDRRGSLWVGTPAGAARIDHPEGASPRFTRYAAPGGLALDSLRALGEDGEGRIYLGSARGLDRLEPQTGRIESFTMGEGLASSIVSVLTRDRRGEMWVGTLAGLSRLRAGGERRGPPPRIFLTGLEVAGVTKVAAGSVASRLAGFELTPDGNRLQIEYAGVSLAPGASLRYETRLLGADRRWSSPGANRSVLLAGLSPGRYRFQVRAVTGSGVASVEPAEVAFRVLPPLWRRAWFLALVALAAALAAWLAHRYRVARLLALERMRTRIASDLHDEVGASLSRVSILSEVAKMRLGPESGSEAGELLSEIGDSSRQLSESMSEIVWALDPRKDSLPSLVARLRRFASDVLEAQGATLEFEAPPAGADLDLDSAERRELYLLIKEAVHNAAKHARARKVGVRLAMAKGSLRVEVRDDGTGLPSALLAGKEESGGLGLASMRQRAALLGGSLRIEPAPGGGTSVSLEMPLSARKRTRRSR